MKNKFAILLFIIFAGCAKPPQTNYFTLEVNLPEPSVTEQAPLLYVENFKAQPMYNQDRFVYKTTDFNVHFDHYKRWVDSPTALLTLETTEYLRTSGLCTLAPSAPFTNNMLVLSSKLLKFHEQVESNQRLAVVSVHFTLMDFSGQKILWDEVIEKSQKIQSTNMDAEAEAMSAAVQAVLQTLLSDISLFIK